ncbi:hypothetical protein AMELA_G00005580 [Ameiurus melas]|uniref:Uncharacterized protein n=1 Tax=Ameiurus melas TaxID=219545 RepID=A0A7J6BJ32_AMEME|nr:hypothetical protein AMELA_G00005580 [Ameiurus melas]
MQKQHIKLLPLAYRHTEYKQKEHAETHSFNHYSLSDLYRSAEEVQNPAAAADVTDVIEMSSSASKICDTAHKKRQVNLLRGNSVNQEKVNITFSHGVVDVY